uniref:Interleukin-4 receptor subunit alpha n=1 Tax=Leptobrachium leishanense TaxID=445787 RepID=A0A8C5QW76_9ANUR
MWQFLVTPTNMAQKTLYLILIVWSVHCPAYLTQEVKKFDCFNDYENIFYCLWEVDTTSRINCSNDFLMKYEEERFEARGDCIPQPMQTAESSINHKCFCQFHILYAGAQVVYNVKLESNGKLVLNDSFHLFWTVKPKPPFNITIDSSDLDSVIVHWDHRHSQYLKDSLIYELQFTSKQDEREVKTCTVAEGKRSYEINKRELKRGHDYLVKVRSSPNQNSYKGTWSEWSSTAEWYNDYGLSAIELLWIIIPSVSALIILLILSSHFGVKYCKKNWLDKIPDPAKSQLVKSKKSWMNPHVNCDRSKHMKKNLNNKIVRDNWLYKFIFKVRIEYDCNAQGGTESDNPVYGVVQDADQRILIPEIPVVENFVQMVSLEDENDTSGSNGTGCEAEETGTQRSELDTSVKNTLLKIAASDFEGLLMDEMETFGRQGSSSTWDGFSCFKHISQKEDLHAECFVDDGYKPEIQNISGQSQLFCFEHFSGYQATSQPDTLSENLYKNFANEVCHSGICMDTGYNSFANLVSGFQHDTTAQTCKDQALPWCTVSNDGCHQWMSPDDPDAPLSPLNLYYQFTFKPKSGQSMDLNQDKIRQNPVEEYPTSTQECSEYQSFSAAIGQDQSSMSFHLEPIDFSKVDSGYKTFECLLNSSTTEVDHGGLHYGKEMEFQPGHFPQNGMEVSGTCDYTETKHPDDKSLSNDERNIANYTQDNTKTTDDDENEDSVPYALTFDISNHMWNVSNTYEDNKSLCNLKSKGLLGNSMSDIALTGCINDIKSPSGLNTVQGRSLTEFLTEQSYQQLKFENMSYFLHPFPSHNFKEDSCGTSTNLLIPEKVLDKDGNLYMRFALLNVLRPEGLFAPGVCEL